MVQEPFPVRPQKAQGLDDSSDCQGLCTVGSVIQNSLKQG